MLAERHVRVSLHSCLNQSSPTPSGCQQSVMEPGRTLVQSCLLGVISVWRSCRRAQVRPPAASDSLAHSFPWPPTSTDMQRHCLTLCTFRCLKGGCSSGQSSWTVSCVMRCGLQNEQDWKGSWALL